MAAGRTRGRSWSTIRFRSWGAAGPGPATITRWGRRRRRCTASRPPTPRCWTPGASSRSFGARRWRRGDLARGVRREDDAAKMREQLAPLTGGQPLALDHDAAAAQSGAFAGGAGWCSSPARARFASVWTRPASVFSRTAGGRFWRRRRRLLDRPAGFARRVPRADGRGPRTRLTAAVFHALDVNDCDGLVRLVNAPGFERDRIAALAQCVFDTAEMGGQVSLEIRERAPCRTWALALPPRPAPC